LVRAVSLNKTIGWTSHAHFNLSLSFIWQIKDDTQILELDCSRLHTRIHEVNRESKSGAGKEVGDMVNTKRRLVDGDR